MFIHEWKYTINPKRFDEVNTSQFRNTRIKTILSYIFGVWFLLILKVAFLASDFYTCIKLLAYNSWSNNVIRPYLPFNISKWLFSGCIFASFLLIIWEMVAGFRVLRTRNIALCYVNKFARLITSITDYSKFCIIDRITPTNTFEKWSFFVFFELKNCVGILFTDTPRQIINALTLWSVVITKNRENLDLGDLESFNDVLSRIRYIGKYNHAEAVLLSFMLFSLAIWLFFMAKLIIAVICSPFIYYKLIQRGEYGSLREFCCIAISTNIDSIVDTEKNKLNGYDSSSILRLRLDDMESQLDSDIFKFSGFDEYELQRESSSDSSISLSDGIHYNNAYNNTTTSFKIYNSNNDEFNIQDEPKRITSVIYDLNPTNNNIHYEKNSARKNRPKPNIQIDTNLMTSAPIEYNHVFTPDKAYFRNIDS